MNHWGEAQVAVVSNQNKIELLQIKPSGMNVNIDSSKIINWFNWTNLLESNLQGSSDASTIGATTCLGFLSTLFHQFLISSADGSVEIEESSSGFMAREKSSGIAAIDENR